MNHFKNDSTASRRQFLAAMGLGGFFYTARGAFAQQLLTATPAQTLGPYYPDVMPLDQDNDLLVINDATTPAIGEISWISGRILDRRGDPVRGALVEIWQADNNGAYIHTRSPIANRDRAFQGYGKFITGSTGQYLFRTVKPGLYPGRTRHVHVQVTAPGGVKLVTQLYVTGDARNAADGVLRGLTAAQQAMVVVPWSGVEGSRIGELLANFDVVLGYTPVENAPTARPTMVSMVHAATLHPGGAAAGLVTIAGTGLEGAAIEINNQPAQVVSSTATEVTVRAPETAGRVEVKATGASGDSTVLTGDLQALMPGLFLLDNQNVNAVRADGSIAAPDGTVKDAATVPARSGEILTLTGTGFGPAAQDSTALLNPVRIQIDTVAAEVIAAELAEPGLARFTVKVPDLADGDHSVTVQAAGVRAAKIGKLRIQNG